MSNNTRPGEKNGGLEAFPELKFPRSLEDVLSKYSIVTTSFKSHSISSPGKDAETVATAPKKARHSGSTKPKPASTNPQPKASQATLSKTSPDDPIVIKLEKGATPSFQSLMSSVPRPPKLLLLCIIVSPSVLDKKDPPVVSTSSKGKSKAAPPSIDEDNELDELDRSEDIYDSIKIPAPGVHVTFSLPHYYASFSTYYTFLALYFFIRMFVIS
ncbi:hypothetical protein Moror_15875 [Moniliophthora roreri MCA 2997]|uniref:Uncharacterized protein n=1 Tax=Moniliophthora roreri (strain MCA 2997) TaxID=1381753 RepID=V2XN38_MONRO|nr:hypothetical protein Moror_15875 [Moniliophthora roreri MCA 2997]